MNIEDLVKLLTDNPKLMSTNYISNPKLAKRLKVSINDVLMLKSLVKKEEIPSEEYTKKIDNEKGTIQSDVETTFEPKNDEELAALHKIDTDKYRISTYWSKMKPNGNFTSSVLATLIDKENSPSYFQEEFITFLKTYKPIAKIAKRKELSIVDGVCIILPKQDAHFNKHDMYGDNDIDKRFDIVYKSTEKMVSKVNNASYIDEIVYIVGSDQFNSEWTGATTKFTPQSNILSYQGAFTEICNHEISVINMLLEYAQNVKIMFLPGNHDEYVGWHLINWLEAYYRETEGIEFNSSIENTKYHRFGNSAMMFNHGDAIKPKELAHKFPIGFKDEWSECEHYFIYTGDRHVEMSLDIHGIKFYQVPQLSNAKSRWDDKQGYIDSKAEMTAFVVTEKKGISDILKDIL